MKVEPRRKKKKVIKEERGMSFTLMGIFVKID